MLIGSGEAIVRRFKKHEDGFTLIELMVVMAIIGILATLAIPSYIGAVHHAPEAIDSYTMEKQKGPQSLQDLVDNGYLRAIPEDPMTHTRDSWVTDTSDAVFSLDQTDPGIDNVHSGSEELGTDGQEYSSW